MTDKWAVSETGEIFTKTSGALVRSRYTDELKIYVDTERRYYQFVKTVKPHDDGVIFVDPSGNRYNRQTGTLIGFENHTYTIDDSWASLKDYKYTENDGYEYYTYVDIRKLQKYLKGTIISYKESELPNHMRMKKDFVNDENAYIEINASYDEIIIEECYLKGIRMMTEEKFIDTYVKEHTFGSLAWKPTLEAYGFYLYILEAKMQHHPSRKLWFTAEEAARLIKNRSKVEKVKVVDGKIHLLRKFKIQNDPGLEEELVLFIQQLTEFLTEHNGVVFGHAAAYLINQDIRQPTTVEIAIRSDIDQEELSDMKFRKVESGYAKFGSRITCKLTSMTKDSCLIANDYALSTSRAVWSPTENFKNTEQLVVDDVIEGCAEFHERFSDLTDGIGLSKKCIKNLLDTLEMGFSIRASPKSIFSTEQLADMLNYEEPDLTDLYVYQVSDECDVIIQSLINVHEHCQHDQTVKDFIKEVLFGIGEFFTPAQFTYHPMTVDHAHVKQIKHPSNFRSKLFTA